MIYCYRCDACKLVTEHQARIGQAPPTLVCQCGSVATRAFSAEGDKVNPAFQAFGNKYPYTSLRLPRNLEGCETNSKGQPIIRSATHEREIMARHGYRRD